MAPSFEDLAQFGVRDMSLDDARAALVHSMLAEDFLAHMGLDVPDEPSNQFYEDADKVLAHYGVLGMKWGRRRNSDGTVTVDKSKTAGNHPGHSDAKAGKSKPRPAKEMTNEELSSAIKRMQLEQQYRQLTTPKKPVLLAETQKILGNALRQNAQAYATAGLGLAVAASLKKAGIPNAQEMASAAKKQSEKADEKKTD